MPISKIRTERCLLVALLWLAMFGTASAIDFDKEVAPLLVRHCLSCHGGADPEGELDLTRHKRVLAGGESGPVMVPGKPDESLLWEYVRDGEMPPEEELPESEKAVLRKWIAQGARWGTDPIDPYRVTTATHAGYDWWSLQPIAKAPRPAVEQMDWPRGEIDYFVLARLEKAGLRPSPPADRRALIRRLSLDLVGLPPSPQDVAEFVADEDPQAYEKLVDRLLASPHYGERWARHWLDVARFGESDGFEFDKPRPHAWPYRDWVINALNTDMPYDEFARRQLAGDVLAPHDDSSITATGFLVGGAFDGLMPAGDKMKQIMRQDELDDLVGVVSQSFLGITVNCARCHDHKFDPIRQTDYYRIASALAGVHRGDRDLPPGKDKSDVAKKVYAVTPRPAPVVHLLKRGSPFDKGEVIAAGGVVAVKGAAHDFGLTPSAAEGERRKQLAAWITSPDNPLFARTIVNRVWHHHFGTGLIQTPNDLGFSGGLPSHPRLLDFLAVSLVEKKWSLKRLHREIVLSATYQQASKFRAGAAKLDAGNRLLWRKTPTRMEAEVVRDTILYVAGKLNPKMGGPGFQDFNKYNQKNTWRYDPVDRVGESYNRRSIYRMWARGGRNPLLDSFDCPDPSTTSPRRAVTTTPLQALVLLNNSFALRMSDAFAERLKTQAGDDRERQVRWAYKLAFGRPAATDEVRTATRFVKQHGLPAFCRVVFNTNEFLYAR